MVGGIEMSDVAADVAAVAAFLAADTTDVLAADTTDVLSAAKAADGGFCPAVTLVGTAKSMVLGLIGLLMAPNQVLTGLSGSDLRDKADYGIDSAPHIQKYVKMFGDPVASGRIFLTFSKIVRNGPPGLWVVFGALFGGLGGGAEKEVKFCSGL